MSMSGGAAIVVTVTPPPTFARVPKVPAEGKYDLALGVFAKFPVSGATYTAGDRYTFSLAAPLGAPVYSGSGLAQELAKAEIDAALSGGSFGALYPATLPDGDEGLAASTLSSSLTTLASLYRILASRWALVAPVVVQHIQSNAVVVGGRVA